MRPRPALRLLGATSAHLGVLPSLRSTWRPAPPRKPGPGGAQSASTPSLGSTGCMRSEGPPQRDGRGKQGPSIPYRWLLSWHPTPSVPASQHASPSAIPASTSRVSPRPKSHRIITQRPHIPSQHPSLRPVATSHPGIPDPRPSRGRASTSGQRQGRDRPCYLPDQLTLPIVVRLPPPLTLRELPQATLSKCAVYKGGEIKAALLEAVKSPGLASLSVFSRFFFFFFYSLF